MTNRLSIFLQSICELSVSNSSNHLIKTWSGLDEFSHWSWNWTLSQRERCQQSLYSCLLLLLTVPCTTDTSGMQMLTMDSTTANLKNQTKPNQNSYAEVIFLLHVWQKFPPTLLVTLLDEFLFSIDLVTNPLNETGCFTLPEFPVSPVSKQKSYWPLTLKEDTLIFVLVVQEWTE